jgi:transposase-like protein
LAGFRFPPKVIMVASYYDIEGLLAERGIEVDHMTVFR